MANINFDEASVGDVNNPFNDALEVMNKGEVGVGVKGVCNAKRGNGVWGESKHDVESGNGVVGVSKTHNGIYGESTTGNGVYGESINGKGVVGVSHTSVGILGVALVAGRFEGNVEVTGDIKLVNADCAEDFDVTDPNNVELGTVMVLTEHGSLQQSYQEYDKKVAGIVSGASGYKPGIILDRQQKQDTNQKNKNKDRLPIALMGKVYCKVDASHSSIEIGDLLTTSSTKGYAMKAEDPMKAFGAVIGKALGSIKEGLGMIPVLVALQ